MKKNEKLSPAVSRKAKAAYEMAMQEQDDQEIAYFASPLCHVFFPYSNPGDSVDFWMRSHGNFHLSIEATSEVNPNTHQREKFGLPYGPKPRLILALLNTVALKQKTPEIKLGNTLTDFIRDHLKLDANGRTVSEVKNQLVRLSTSIIKATYTLEQGHTYREAMSLIRGIDIWWGKDNGQRHLWGNYLRFSDDYFNNIMEHGVPVDRTALGKLADSALELDLYAFLAHRLHHIPINKPVQVSWKAMKDQFGYTYNRMDNFKARFRVALKHVRVAAYRDAKIEEIENRGFLLYNSKPAVPAKTSIILPVSTTNQPKGIQTSHKPEYL